MRLKPSCPFCRKPSPRTAEALDKLRMKRVEANDPMALCGEGATQRSKGNHTSACDYFAKAAKLGFVEACYRLGCLHLFAQGVEKDEGKGKDLLEEAAIGGHPKARHILGAIEWNNGRYERANRHFIIAANLGDDEAMEQVKKSYQAGLVSKDDFASTLRAHHAAVDAMKSPHREAADADAHYCEFLRISRSG